MTASRLIPPTAAAWLALAAGVSWADTLDLRDGGVLRGVSQAEQQPDRLKLTLQSSHGRIVLDRKVVDRVRRESPAEVEYRRRAPTVSDTETAQFALAAWCRDNGVSEGMRRHLKRVLELAPDHAEARALLGYQQVDGRWMTRDEVLASRGLVRWGGGYRTKQEAALLERAAKIEEEQVLWRKKLAGWRSDLESRNAEVARAASDALDSLRDPASAPELLKLFGKEKNPVVRRKLTDVLGRLNTSTALVALADVALADPDPELRAMAREYLAKDNRPGLTAPFVGALRSKDNAIINNAGDALAALGSFASIDPLIEALVTTHRWRVGNDSGGDTYSMNTGTGTFGFGGGGPQDIQKDFQNPRVLAALVYLTGENYLYNKDQWRAWLASLQVEQAVDLRRDL
ncbi:hypothetical protein MalM25_34400 [Planctomycetes bacterium MalM25]|nr:hypothetical protein MalM25_34400 [Planctomycetes bacterium MalM25]